MKFIITEIRYHSETPIVGVNGNHFHPAYYVFCFKQIEAPAGVNSTVEIVLFKSDKRVKQWMKAFNEEKELSFDIGS